MRAHGPDPWVDPRIHALPMLRDAFSRLLSMKGLVLQNAPLTYLHPEARKIACARVSKDGDND